MNQRLIFPLLLTMLVTGLFFSLSYEKVSTTYTSPDAITCPSSLVLDADENCEAEVIVNLPYSSLGCHFTSLSYTLPDGTIVTLDPSSTDPVNLGFWPAGSYQLSWNIDESCDDGTMTSAICIQNITISDKLPPVLICPDDVSVGNDADGRRPGKGGRSGFTYVLVGQPTASDNCTSDVQIIITHDSDYGISDDDASGEYPLGTTIVCWTAEDLAGNQSTCCMEIVVYDNTPPVIVCPDTINVSCTNLIPDPYVDIEDFIDAGGTASDDIALDSLSFSFIEDEEVAMECLYKRTIHRFYTISDTNGNSDTCFQVIFINDTIPPIAQCKDVTVHLDATGSATLTADDLDDGSYDHCGSVTLSTETDLIFGCNDLAAGGQVEIVLIVTDVCGNSSTCLSTVTIQDEIPPTITCPAPITVDADAGNCYATDIDLGSPSISDNCLIIEPLSVTFNGAPITSGTEFPVGTHTVVWTVTDLGGNTATCNQTVIVEDHENPMITCPQDITISTDAGLCHATNVDIGNPIVSDNCAIDFTEATLNGITVTPATIFSHGSNEVIWTVTDIHGNTASCTQIITVVDIELPMITCPADFTISTDSGQCFATDFATGTPDVSDNCAVDNVTATFNNEEITPLTTFEQGSNNIIWTVTDVNGNTATCIQVVTVIDTENPEIICPINQNISLDANCMLNVPDLTAMAITNDNCGVASVTQSPEPGTIISILHGQTLEIVFKVTDHTGNSASCSTIITAQDLLGPDIVCKNPVVISFNDFTEVPAAYFVQSATDNCGGDLTYSVRRMGNICGESIPDDFGPYAVFCCDDIGEDLMLVVSVADQYGNVTECMTTVILQETIPPVIVEPLPDVTISCLFGIDIDDMGIFGTFAGNEADRQDIIINDPHTFYPLNGLVGRDGLFSDMCEGVTVTSTVRNALDAMCHTGNIYRDFLITDKSGNTTTFTQTIQVVNTHPFVVDDITWPEENFIVDGCSISAADPSISGSPMLDNSFCSMAGATYIDLVLGHPLYCQAIRRTWTVLDWCQYDKRNPDSDGKWTFVQNIFINNTIPPVIEPNICRDTVICTGNGCTATNVTFTATGTDDCQPTKITWKYKIDINNDGGIPDYSGAGATVTRTYPLGQHKMTWEATDGCGNNSTCSFLFTVSDCKKPTPIAIKGLAMNLMAPGVGSIKAKIFNNGSTDNCTPTNQLKYSYSKDINDTLRVFTCDSLGDRRIELWVTDLAGNQSVAVTFLHVQGNQNICGTSGRIAIVGSVYSEEKAKISNVKVVIDGAETEGNSMTDQDGQYHFDDLAMYNDYQIVPYKDENPLEGVSTLDIVMIQRHILGLETLNSPYKIIAADVNGSNSVSASDLTELRKLILGVNDKFSNNGTSWRFADAGYVFEDPENPWYFNDNLLYENLENNMSTSDFIAIKMGDVNGTVSAELLGNTQSRSNLLASLIVDDKALVKNELSDIAFGISQNMTLAGMQFSIELNNDVEFRGIESESLPLRQENIYHFVKNGKTYINISFDQVHGFELNEKTALFNLIVMPKKNISTKDVLQLNDKWVLSEIYNTDLETGTLSLRFKKPNVVQENYLIQNQPNPFREETLIGIYQAKPGPVSMMIFDATGKMVSSENMVLQAGFNQISINSNQLKNRLGVFYCKIKSQELNQVLKLLRIE